MTHDDSVPGDTEELARLRARRNEIDDEAFEYAEQVEHLRTRLQRAEELLRDLRGIVSTAESDGWHVDDIPERIDAFLGDCNGP